MLRRALVYGLGIAAGVVLAIVLARRAAAVPLPAEVVRFAIEKGPQLALSPTGKVTIGAVGPIGGGE